MPPSTPTDAPARARSTDRPAWPAALVLDVLLVLVFAAVGRGAHSLDPGGALGTAWPFLAGLLAGWAVWRLPRAPFGVWPGGVALWLTTVGAGMALRALTGEGTAPSFVLVTVAVLGVFLLGPRLLVQLLRPRRTPGTA